MKLNYGLSDVVINWAGGLHHAKKSEVGAGLFLIFKLVVSVSRFFSSVRMRAHAA